MKIKYKTDEFEIEGKKLKLTNIDKVFWNDEGYTKGDVINYYLEIADLILPYLKNRLQVLHRNPNGILDNGFYQKNLTQHPLWIKTYPINRDSDGATVNYVSCNDLETLIYLVNLGCIELNIWSSQTNKLNFPDFAVLDLDPLNINFEKVLETALVVKDILNDFEIDSFCKTSGKKGLHVFFILGAKYSFDKARAFVKQIADLTHEKLPILTSLERSPANRNNRVYLDFLQNSFGQTISAPYSLRPFPGALVSTPLKWSELKTGLLPSDFNIKTAPSRFRIMGDLFAGLLTRNEIA